MRLAGDIGGTKTVLALIDNDVRKPTQQETFPSDDYPSLEAIIADFLSDKQNITAASFGVAGPVVNNRAQITNLPWLVDGATIGQKFDIPHVTLLNDLESIANAVPYLEGDDLITLNVGQPEETGAIGVIAPGTGLGEAFLVWDGDRYQAHPSEGGHAAFGPGNKLQIELLQYLHGRYDHVSYERVCSGIGIPNLYDFFKDSGRYEEPVSMFEKLSRAEDRTPIIVQAALQEKNPVSLSQATLDMFVDILGDEAGNLALKVLATGGIYIGGGIPPRILSRLKRPSFLEAFRRKGRFADLMVDIPIHVITDPLVALHGAAYHCLAIDQNG